MQGKSLTIVTFQLTLELLSLSISFHFDPGHFTAWIQHTSLVLLRDGPHLAFILSLHIILVDEHFLQGLWICGIVLFCQKLEHAIHLLLASFSQYHVLVHVTVPWMILILF